MPIIVVDEQDEQDYGTDNYAVVSKCQTQTLIRIFTFCPVI